MKALQQNRQFSEEDLQLTKESLEKLLLWYQSAKRDLPWRKTKDPYSIWISEIMLQQTRVEAVIEYYKRFLETLPTVSSLANASEELVLKLWEGLGYYSRARNLRKAAQQIMTEHQGEFPRDFDAIRKLSGIGEYTAGSISSIAFDLPVPAVDGNVLRVMSRVLNDFSDIAEVKTKKSITELLRTVYPKTQCGDVTQSLMELGAMVCVPNGQPKCGECPLASLCRAKHEGTVDSLPVKSEKTKRKIQKKTVLLLQFEETFALRKRVEKGLLHGMWEIPNLDQRLSRKEISEMFPNAIAVKKIGVHRHIFTHIEWEMECYHIIVKEKNSDYIWETAQEIRKHYAVPAAFRPFCIWEK